MMTRTSSLNKIIEAFLRWSSAASLLLMAAGLIVFFIGGPESMWQPGAVMAAGVILLVAIPFLRVAGQCISFLYVDRDVKYALLSLGLLAILAVGLVLSRLGK